MQVDRHIQLPEVMPPGTSLKGGKRGCQTCPSSLERPRGAAGEGWGGLGPRGARRGAGPGQRLGQGCCSEREGSWSPAAVCSTPGAHGARRVDAPHCSSSYLVPAEPLRTPLSPLGLAEPAALLWGRAGGGR